MYKNQHAKRQGGYNHYGASKGNGFGHNITNFEQPRGGPAGYSSRPQTGYNKYSHQPEDAMFKKVKPGNQKFNDEDDQINSYSKRSTQNFKNYDDFTPSKAGARNKFGKFRNEKENNFGHGDHSGPSGHYRD